MTDIKLLDHFKVGKTYSDDCRATPDMVDSRFGGFAVSTSALAHSLHVLACSVVDDTLPENHHSLTRGSYICQREPIFVGDHVKMMIRVNRVAKDGIDFDLKVLKPNEDVIAADGSLRLKVIMTEGN